MVDLPERSVMVSGLDQWEMRGKGAFRVIEERRLVQLLEERLRGDPRIAQGRPLSLRTPPLDPGAIGGGLGGKATGQLALRDRPSRSLFGFFQEGVPVCGRLSSHWRVRSMLGD